MSKYADPIAAEPSDALAPALEHADARARLLASLKSHKHKEMVQAGMNVSINVAQGEDRGVECALRHHSETPRNGEMRIQKRI